jgi:ABC-2 type transport system permease protein
MIDVLRSEWIKLHTVLVHWVLVLVAVVFPVGVTVLVAIFADVDTGGMSSLDVADLIVGLSIVSSMLLGTTAAISLTSEYTHNTIRPTYAANPGRSKVVIVKVALNTVVAVVVLLVIEIIAWAAASLILSSRDTDISLGDDKVLTYLGSGVVLAALVSWFGFGLGLIIRNSPATISVLLLWPLLIEGLIAVMFALIGWDGAVKWLPYSAALTATGSGDSSDVLGRPGGQLLFAAVGIGLIALGSVLDRRRDA